MIGSDWPVCTVAADYRRTVGVVVEYLRDRPLDVQEAVLGGNAQKFWKLKPVIARCGEDCEGKIAL